jgi:hypothetical protein
MRVAFVLVLERIANVFATPFADEPFFRREQKEGSAHPFVAAAVHAIWRGALLLVDPIGREPAASPLLLAVPAGGGCTWTIGACWSIAASALRQAYLLQADWAFGCGG